MIKNKWTLEIKDCYILENGQELIRTYMLAIPPTDGNRTDIIGESRKYYLDTSEKKFSQRMSKEEYLDKSMPSLEEKERKKILNKISWTPRVIDDQIAVIIDITGGKLTIRS